MLVAVLIKAVLLLIALAVLAYLLSERGRLLRKIRSRETELQACRSALAAGDKANQKLQSRAEWFQCLFAGTRGMVLVFGVQSDNMPGPFMEVNAAACNRLKYSRQELLKLSLVDIECSEPPAMGFGYKPADLVVLSEDYIQQRQQQYVTRTFRSFTRRVLDEGQLNVEREFRDRDGNVFPVVENARTMAFGSEKVIVLTVADITDRKAVEKKLAQSEQRFHRFFKESPIGIAIYDNRRQLIDVNPACLRIFGVPGKTEFERFNIFDNPYIPDDIRLRISVGENVRLEAKIAFGDAPATSLLISGRRDTAYLDVMIHQMDSAGSENDGGYFVQVQDVSRRRRTEEELHRHAKQLLQSDKLEAIGSMVGGIAHDFKNVLTPIIGYAELVVKMAAGSDELLLYAGKIKQAAERARDLVSQLVTFSRQDQGSDEKLQPTAVTPIVREVLDQQAATLPDNIVVETAIKTKNDNVMASSGNLHQVLMNICTNAVQSMQPDGGTLKVLMQDFYIKYAGSRSELPRGYYLRISISDTGIGIDDKTMRRIFDPFFTTKTKGKGTGMGLALVHGLVKRLNGDITVESEIGRGTAFHVVLPLIQSRGPIKQTVESRPRNDQAPCILLVDDDAEVLEVLSAMLKSLGYACVAVGRPEEALDLFQRQPDRFGAVIVDRFMPSMSGASFIDAVQEIRHEIPAILCSGQQSNAGSTTLANDNTVFLNKPVDLGQLQETLRLVLADEKSPQDA